MEPDEFSDRHTDDGSSVIEDEVPAIVTFTEPESTGIEESHDDPPSESAESAPDSLHDLLREMRQEDNHPSGDAELETLRTKLDGMSRKKINAKDENGKTALHIAVERGLKRAVIKLISSGARVAVQDKDKNQPLHCACSSGNPWCAKELLAKGANLEARGDFKETPLIMACRHGHAEVVELLLHSDAKTRVFATERRSPLYTAAQNGHTEVVKLMLAKDPTLIDETETNVGWTPLHAAVYNKHEEIAKLLHEAGARLDILDTDGWTPLMTAVRQQHEDIIATLLRPRSEDEDLYLETRDLIDFTPLGVASMQGFTAGARLLIDAGADCTAQSSDKKTPALTSACSWRHREIVEAMLTRSKQPIDGNIKDSDGWAALNLASNHGHTRIVELLLEHQEAISLTDESKTSALLAAVSGGCESVVKVLLGPGKVPVSTMDVDDKTALHYACDASGSYSSSGAEGPDNLTEQERSNPEFSPGRHEAVLRLLLQEGADIEARTQKQETALHLTARFGDANRLEVVLDHMEDELISAENEDGETALCLAFKEKQEGTARALLTSPKLKTAEFGSEEAERDALSWAAVSRERHDIAKLLMAKTPKAIESPAPPESTAWSVIEWATFQKLPRALWLLIASSPRSNETRNMLTRAMKLAEEMKDQPELVAKDSSTQPSETASSSASSSSDGTGSNEESSDGGTNASHQCQPNHQHVLMDILRDPPIALLCSDSDTYHRPQHEEELTETLANFHSTVVQFYHGRNESSVIKRVRTVEEMIYKSGPKSIMDETMRSLREIVGTDGVVPKMVHIDTKPKFSWVHLPATNMVWMNDLLTRIMKDENYDADQFGKVRSFFRDSWVEIPDRTSPSRIIRPRVVMRGFEKEEPASSEKKETKEEGKKKKGDGVREDVDGGLKRSQTDAKKGTTQPTNEGEVKTQAFIPASALYIPYLSFSTYCPELGECHGADASNGHQKPPAAKKVLDDVSKRQEDAQQAKLKKLRVAKRNFDGLLEAYEGSVVHGSPTLDEWYYHFAENHDSTKDKRHRNKTQVVTKSVRGDVENLSHWPVVRINQLWVWTIDNKWIITASPYPMGGGEDSLLEGIFDHLGKKAEAEGSRSQPRSVTDMTRFLVDYCIGFYERRPRAWGQDDKPESQLSIRQIFSNSINTIGRNEAILFENSSAQTREWREQRQRTSRAKSSPGAEITEAIEKAEKLYCDIKDIRDELNILKSAARYQKAIQDALADGRLMQADLTAGYVVNDIREMDNVADRIQTAVNTTLSLQQSESANLQAALSVEQGQQAAKQGRTLMVFTVVTILFMPLSFLSSLFAMDVESFQKSPRWAFAVIFSVSFVVFLPLALYSIYSDEVSRLIAQFGKKDHEQGTPTKEGHGTATFPIVRVKSADAKSSGYRHNVLSQASGHPDVNSADEAGNGAKALFTVRSRSRKVSDEERGG